MKKQFAASLECFAALLQSGRPFSAGTHDPVLLEGIKELVGLQSDLLEVGFLKGLADETKLKMAGEGWKVAEYVPFGRSKKSVAD